METKTIPNTVAAEMLSFTTEVCACVKGPMENHRNLFQAVNTSLLGKWKNECQSMTDMEEREWKVLILRDLLRQARQARVPWWHRFLSYEENRYARYIVILLGSAVASYLYPEDLILATDYSWAGMEFPTYLAIAAAVLMFGFVMVSIIVLAEANANFDRLKKFVGQASLVGLGAQFTLLWSTYHHLHDEQISNYYNASHAILGSVSCGVAMYVAAMENSSVKTGGQTDSQIVTPIPESDPRSSDRAEAEGKSNLALAAIQVGDVALMDFGARRDEIAREIYDALLERCQKASQVHQAEDRAKLVLGRFGPISEIGDTDRHWFRVLFYRRHQSTRYLAIIGLSMAIVFLQLITSISFGYRSGNIIPLSFDRWNINILFGGLIAVCVSVTRASLNVKWWPVGIAFGLISAGLFAAVCVSASIAFSNIHQHWSNPWSDFGAILLAPVLLITLVCILICVVCGSFEPFSEPVMIRIHRRVMEFSEFFGRD